MSPGDEPPRAETRKIARQIARDILNARKDLLIGIRELTPLLHQLGWAADDDFDTMFTVEAEIDDLPLGHERTVWPRKMWPEIDRELTHTKKRYRRALLAECQRLLQRLAEASVDAEDATGESP